MTQARLARAMRGDSLGKHLKAETWNSFVDAANRSHGVLTTGTGGTSREVPRNTTILLRNDTDEVVNAGDVLAYGDVSILPNEADTVWTQHRPVFKGTVPASSDSTNIAILRDGGSPGEIVEGVVHGVVPCRVYTATTKPVKAGRRIGEKGELLGGGGNVTIMWIDEGTGVKDAVVLLSPQDSYQSGAGDPINNTVTPGSGIGSRYFDTTLENWWTATGTFTNSWTRISNQATVEQYRSDGTAIGSGVSISTGVTSTLFTSTYMAGGSVGTGNVTVSGFDSNGVIEVVDTTAYYRMTLNLKLTGATGSWSEATLNCQSSSSAGSGFASSADVEMTGIELLIPPNDVTGTSGRARTFTISGIMAPERYFRWQLTNNSANTIQWNHPTRIQIEPIEDL